MINYTKRLFLGHRKRHFDFFMGTWRVPDPFLSGDMVRYNKPRPFWGHRMRDLAFSRDMERDSDPFLSGDIRFLPKVCPQKDLFFYNSSCP
jgi:hypothetical protein